MLLITCEGYCYVNYTVEGKVSFVDLSIKNFILPSYFQIAKKYFIIKKSISNGKGMQ